MFFFPCEFARLCLSRNWSIFVKFVNIELFIVLVYFSFNGRGVCSHSPSFASDISNLHPLSFFVSLNYRLLNIICIFQRISFWFHCFLYWFPVFNLVDFSNFYSFFFSLKIRSHCVTEAGLKLMSLFPPLLKCQDYRRVPHIPLQQFLMPTLNLICFSFSYFPSWNSYSLSVF
jgi:hypothetical protein